MASCVPASLLGFLINGLLVNALVPVLPVHGQQWCLLGADPEILPVAMSRAKPSGSRCWWEAAPCSAEDNAPLDAV